MRGHPTCDGARIMIGHVAWAMGHVAWDMGMGVGVELVGKWTLGWRPECPRLPSARRTLCATAMGHGTGQHGHGHWQPWYTIWYTMVYAAIEYITSLTLSPL